MHACRIVFLSGCLFGEIIGVIEVFGEKLYIVQPKDMGCFRVFCVLFGFELVCGELGCS